MATWIAHYDNAGVLLLPPTSVAPGAAPDVAAQAMGWADGSWRVITDAEAEELMQPPPPTPEEQQAAFTAAIQQRLDAFAQTRGYDSILSAASYAASRDELFSGDDNDVRRRRHHGVEVARRAFI